MFNSEAKATQKNTKKYRFRVHPLLFALKMEYSIHAISARELTAEISEMKRIYPSGASKRKKKEEAKAKTDTLPKLTSFFNVTPVDTNALEGFEEDDESPAAVDQAAGGELAAESDNPDVSTCESAVSVSCCHEESDVPPLGDDPASWPEVFTDRKRCDLVKRGPVQLQLECPKNTEGRRFTNANSAPLHMLEHIYKENVLDIYPNMSIALRHLLTLPVTVASGERSFSTLKRLKTYMRSTMAQDRLSALTTISIEHEVQQSLDMDEVISRFAEAKVRKFKFV